MAEENAQDLKGFHDLQETSQPSNIQPPSELKQLLDQTLKNNNNSVNSVNENSDKTNVDLTNLHSLLANLINNQQVILSNFDHSYEKLDVLENVCHDLTNKLGNLEKWTSVEKKEDTKTKEKFEAMIKEREENETNGYSPLENVEPNSTRTSKTSFDAAVSLDRTSKSVLPPLKSSQSLNKRKSVISSLSLNQMNYADKYDIQKLNRRLDLLADKLKKMSNVVPSNDDIFDMVRQQAKTIEDQVNELKNNTSTSEDQQQQPVKDAWSKMMLTKRIDANESSLEKFLELLDKLALDVDNLKLNLANWEENYNQSLAGADQNSSEIADIKDQLKAQKNDINSNLAKISDLLKRIKTMENDQAELQSKLEISKDSENLAGNLTDLSGKYEKFKETSDKRMNGLEDDLANLDALLKNLSNQITNLGNVSADGTQSPVSAGPDLETLKTITEMRSKLSRLEPRIEELESLSSNFKDNENKLQELINSNQNISPFDSDAFKLQLLSEMPDIIDQNLSSIYDRITALENDTEKLNGIIKYKLDSSAIGNSFDGVDTSNFAEKQMVKKMFDEKAKQLQDMDRQINGQISQLHEQIVTNGKNLWAEIDKLKLQISNYSEDVANLTKKVIENDKPKGLGFAISPPPSDESQKTDLNGINTISPQISALLEKLQSKAIELEDRFNDHIEKLTIIDNKGNERSKLIDELLARVQQLQVTKADLHVVEDELAKKADKKDLDSRVKRDNFDLVITDINEKIDNLLQNVVDMEGKYRDNLTELFSNLGGKMDKSEMDPFRNHLESRLKALTSLLEKTNSVGGMYQNVEADQAAVFRKPLIGYKCVSCSKDAKPQISEPVASIPSGGFMPGSNHLRPYTTFELHNIRSHGKRLIGCSNSLNRFNKIFGTIGNHSGTSNFMGRPCGGDHTLTTPSRRYVHLKQLSDVWADQNVSQKKTTKEDQFIGQNVKEINVMGNDGHIYKGREKYTNK